MPTTSLRDRRKVETRALIQGAALRLAHERGIEAVTIEAICRETGISQRTFHNYFAFKEAVFVVVPEPLPTAAVERFLSAPGDLMTDLTDLMVAHAAEMQHTRWLGRVLREIAMVHPRLMPLQMAEFLQFDRRIQEVLGTRLGLPADDTACAVLAGAVLGANRVTIDRWMEQPDQHLPDAVRAGLDALVSLIRRQDAKPRAGPEDRPAD